MVHTGGLQGAPPVVSSHTAGLSSAINSKEELRCILEQQQQGHQQPVTCMDVVGNFVFTGSQDHTLKVGVL